MHPSAPGSYAYGLVLWCLFSGRSHPWQDAAGGNIFVDVFTLGTHIKEGNRPDLTALRLDTPPTVSALIQRCWAHDPAARPTALAIACETETWLVAMHRDDDDMMWGAPAGAGHEATAAPAAPFRRVRLMLGRGDAAPAEVGGPAAAALAPFLAAGAGIAPVPAAAADDDPRRPHVCEDCGHAFPNLSTLLRHALTHKPGESGFPFACPIVGCTHREREQNKVDKHVRERHT